MEAESEEFSDMIVVDFIDAYKNLSIKIYTMMIWKQEYCDEASYFLRTNDDTIVNFTNLQSFITNNSENVEDLQIYGSIIRRPIPKRDMKNKWYVSTKEYSGQIYPDFCAGWSCLYTKPAVEAVLDQASSTNYLWLDDVLFGGILAQKGNVSRIHLQKLFMPHFKFKHYYNFICGSFGPVNFIAAHFHELDQFLKNNGEIDCNKT
uniref:Hexosyltransferase n=1 Tax=Panagrolaimus sp. JU765 TaxID=591449 RepID=A0AC34QZD3_9BILA